MQEKCRSSASRCYTNETGETFWRYHTPCDWMTQIDKDPESNLILRSHILVTSISHVIVSLHVTFPWTSLAVQQPHGLSPAHGTMALPLLITWMASCLWPWGEENPASIHWNLIMETYGLDPIQTLKFLIDPSNIPKKLMTRASAMNGEKH